jgi:hypothetical protein
MSDISNGFVHKAAPGEQDPLHCAICGQWIKRITGGHGTTWVHEDSGTVAAPNPPAGGSSERSSGYSQGFKDGFKAGVDRERECQQLRERENSSPVHGHRKQQPADE